MPKNDNDPQLSAAALFRYLVVSQLRARRLRGATKAEAIREVMALPHCDLDGRPRPLSERSLYRWLEAYQSHGLAGLETAPGRRSTTPRCYRTNSCDSCAARRSAIRTPPCRS